MRVAYSRGKRSKESMDDEVWMNWTFIFVFGGFVSDYSWCLRRHRAKCFASVQKYWPTNGQLTLFYCSFDMPLMKMIRCQPWATRCAATNFSSTAYLWHPSCTAPGALPTQCRCGRWTRSQCAKPFRVGCWSRSCRRWTPQKIAAWCVFCLFLLNLFWRLGHVRPG